ncbi:MAG: 4'-phosphopantetheinyl transferase superfamily protein [Desulfobacter sp.]|nr:MAG: 4'-phosphopantetheinyl transferase superfamily protein [Desulfobacter sp.]
MREALSADRVHLFYTRARDTDRGDLLTLYRSVLSRDEIQKAERFRDKTAGHLSLTARALVRYLVSEYTGLSPERLVFTANDHGKPALDPDMAVPGLKDIRFNLSHCKGGVVCGLCLGREIGVDIESLGRRVDPAVADRFFSPSEAARVRAAEGEGARKAAFLNLWTLKEAYIKARGGGLSIPLDSFSFDAKERVEISFKDDRDRSAGWQFFRWHPEPGKLAAAAVCSPGPLAFRTFRCIPFESVKKD